MLIGAFDASGDKKSPVLAVAGFVSSENDWRDFSQAWSQRLAKDNIEFFRAVDAAFFNGPFEHWKGRADRDDLRKVLFRDLMDILKRHVYHRFGCVITNDSFDEMSEEIRKKFRLTSYTLASLSCEKQFRKWVLQDFAGSRPICQCGWCLRMEMKGLETYPLGLEPVRELYQSRASTRKILLSKMETFALDLFPCKPAIGWRTS